MRLPLCFVVAASRLVVASTLTMDTYASLVGMAVSAQDEDVVAGAAMHAGAALCMSTLLVLNAFLAVLGGASHG